MKTLLHLQDLQKSFGQQLVLNHVLGKSLV